MRGLRVGILLGHFDHSVSDHYLVMKRREPITKWRGVTSHQNNRYFSLRAAFVFRIFNAAWARVWMSACLQNYVSCPFWFVCCQAEFVCVQSLLVGLHPAELLLRAPRMTSVSEVGLSCLIVTLLRAFPVEWAYQPCQIPLLVAGSSNMWQ